MVSVEYHTKSIDLFRDECLKSDACDSRGKLPHRLFGGVSLVEVFGGNVGMMYVEYSHTIH